MARHKKGITDTLRGRIPYTQKRSSFGGIVTNTKLGLNKRSVMGGRIANTKQGIKNIVAGGPGGWSTSKRYGYRPSQKRNEVAMVFDEVLPGITCAADCIRANFGHRIGLNKKSKYSRRCRC